MYGNGTLIPIYVNTGDIITAKAYDDLVKVFAYDLGYNSGIQYVYKNDPLTADSINALRDSINRIIDITDYDSHPVPVEPIDPRGGN